MENDNKDLNKKKWNENEKTSTRTYEIEGVGSVTYIGEWDIEKIILRLLKSKYITG